MFSQKLHLIYEGNILWGWTDVTCKFDYLDLKVIQKTNRKCVLYWNLYRLFCFLSCNSISKECFLRRQSEDDLEHWSCFNFENVFKSNFHWKLCQCFLSFKGCMDGNSSFRSFPERLSNLLYLKNQITTIHRINYCFY